MANGDPYDYARSPVEIGLSAALGAARDSYLQRAEYEKTKAEMKIKRDIRNAEALHKEASLAVSQGQLAETKRYHDIMAGTQGTRIENLEKWREKSLQVRQGEGEANRATRIQAAQILSGGSYARLAWDREKLERTTFPVQVKDASGNILTLNLPPLRSKTTSGPRGDVRADYDFEIPAGYTFVGSEAPPPTPKPGPTPPKGIPRIKGTADYNALSSGSQYYDPQGNLRRKK